MNMNRALCCLVLAFLATTLTINTAWATLGGTGDSVAADRRTLTAASLSTADRGKYTLHELRSDGVTIREYISPSNIVFAVAWNGVTNPDLDQLLGTYAGEYQTALAKSERKPGSRNQSRVTTDRIVVERWGHMRNLQGRAYVPALVPEGVDIDEIK
jgi:hypothetical protein